MRLMAWLGCGRALLIALFAGAAAAQSGGAWTFIDDRDGKKYKAVAIGRQKWMAENLNIKTDNSWCYGGADSNCVKYGRLYNWNAAKTVCPKGWRLPSRAAWDTLTAKTGGYEEAGKRLKSASGWDSSGSGTDDFGFSAKPGGRRDSDGSFEGAGKGGYWWTATEYGIINAFTRRIRHGHDNVYENVDVKRIGRSVRCVAD